MRPCCVGVVGANAVGKTSFVLALGAKAAAGLTNVSQHHLVSTFIWPRPGGKGPKKTLVHVLHSREEALDGDDDRVFVLLFDLTRRDSLATVMEQWAHLSDTPGRRLLLVGTHADCTSTREVLPAEIREISGEFHAYEEVCCRPGHFGGEGMRRVQLTLTQWTSRGASGVAKDIPVARASICGGFPRPVVTMMMPAGTSYSLPASPAGPQMRADVWLHDPTEAVSSGPMSTGEGGDVKLRTISKAIYDIRGAVAEKSKVLAKYRDRQMSHWLTRSRYFGPTESSRHKRWQEEQKKRQQLSQGHVHHHHAGHMRHQSITPNALQDERGRSASQPDTFEAPSRNPSTRCSPVNYYSPNFNENECSPGTHKSFMQPADRMKQRQREPEAAILQEQKKRTAAKRALRKQWRAASNDIYERSTSPAVFYSYLNCYDEMDMPPQLQPSSPSDRRKLPSRPSPASSVASFSTSRKSFASKGQDTFEPDSFTLAGAQHSGADPASRLATPLPATHLQSPVASITSPPATSSHPMSAQRPVSPQYECLSDTVLKLTRPAESKSSLPSPAMAVAFPKSTLRGFAPHEKYLAISRSNTVCSSGSDCSDIDDMLEYFDGLSTIANQ